MSKLTYALVAIALCIGVQVPGVMAADQTIVEIAVGNEDFSSLVEAVVSQDLVEALSSAGPFTVFAPTNAAFAALPSFVGTALAAKPELLTDILLYHVVAGELDAAHVLSQRNLTALNEGRLMVRTNMNQPRINQANIVATDIEASNGVIHVIDGVLIPQSVYEESVRQLKIQIRDLYRQMRDIYQARAEAGGR